MLDILCEHPATARRIATKIARTFIADDPPEDVVARAAQAFSTSGGRIDGAVREIIGSEAFAMASGRKIKRPFRLVVSSLRALGADTHAKADVMVALGRMGHSPYTWPSPDGYPDRGEAWLGVMGERFRFARDLAGGKLDGARVSLPALCRAAGGEDALAAHVLGRRPDDGERAALDHATDLAPKVALLLASPAFQRY